MTHPDFLDAQGHTRVAWLLDLSAPPRGVHPDLEQKFGVLPSTGSVLAGAVWSAADIDAAIAAGDTSTLPARRGGPRHARDRRAPPATARSASRSTGASRRTRRSSLARDHRRGDDVDRHRRRAPRRRVPLRPRRRARRSPSSSTSRSAATSVRTTARWPGSRRSRATSARRIPGTRSSRRRATAGRFVDDAARAPERLREPGRDDARAHPRRRRAQDGGVQVWVAMHAGATLRVGLDGPDGTWIAPGRRRQLGGQRTRAATARPSTTAASRPAAPCRAQSHGAVVGLARRVARGHVRHHAHRRRHRRPLRRRDGRRLEPRRAPARVRGRRCARARSTFRPRCPRSSASAAPSTRRRGPTSTAMRSASSCPCSIPRAALRAPAACCATPVDGEPCWFSSAGPTLDRRRQARDHGAGRRDRRRAVAAGRAADAPTSIFANGRLPVTTGATTGASRSTRCTASRSARRSRRRSWRAPSR